MLDEERISLVAGTAEKEITPISDVRASAWYRTQMINHLTQKLLRDVSRRDD
jgi:CO/xanthine dehydrogenase FAD-binding subunit